MSLRSKFFAMMYDGQMAKAEKLGLHAMRERLLAGATGDIIEIGAGTGLNLTCYGPEVRTLTMTEPGPRCCGAWSGSFSSSMARPVSRWQARRAMMAP